MRVLNSLWLVSLLGLSSAALAQEPIEVETEVVETSVEALSVPEAQGQTYLFLVVIGSYDIGADSSRLYIQGSNNDFLFLMNMGVQTGLMLNMTYFNNESATSFNILDGLERVVSGLEPEDTLLICWIGNGSRDAEHGALFWPYDVDFSGPSAFLGSVIRPSELTSILDKKPDGSSVALFLDTVHDGAYNAMAFTGPVADDFAQSDLLVFSATESHTPSAPSLFSQTLIDGFYGVADRNPTNGIITADELASYLMVEMTDKTNTRPGLAGDWDRQALRTYDPATRQTEPTVEWTLSQADSEFIERRVARQEANPLVKPVRYGALGLGLAAVATNAILLTQGNALKRDLEDPLTHYDNAADWERDERRYTSMRTAVPVLWSFAGATLAISGVTFAVSPTSTEISFRF